MRLFKNRIVIVYSYNLDIAFSDILPEFARTYMSTILVYNLPRLHIPNINKSDKRKYLKTKYQGADDILQKL